MIFCNYVLRSYLADIENFQQKLKHNENIKDYEKFLMRTKYFKRLYKTLTLA